MHEAGYVFNDLKLDNLLLETEVDQEYLSSTMDNFFKKCKIVLIDFGFATQYIDEASREHLKKYRVKVFRGNMELASLNQMKF